MSTIIDNLVTDRTQADVERVKALAGKGFFAMTAVEQAEWLAGMKGAYNASDLNRVGTALNYLAGRLAPLCGKNIQWSAKTDWSMTDVITAPQAAVYRKQIQDVRDALTYPDGTPADPKIDEALAKLTTPRARPGDVVTTARYLDETWHVCDGSTFSQTDYPALYAVLGSTTLPDISYSSDTTTYIKMVDD